MTKDPDALKQLIFIGVLVGAIMGAILGNYAGFPAGWGIFGGGFVGGLIVLLIVRPKVGPDETGKRLGRPYAALKLREEELEITKMPVTTGKVGLHTEVVTEEKQISVPVRREELVIEKTVLINETADHPEPVTETIRIPVREERVEISKRPVILADVNIEERQYQTVEPIETIVKKEKLKIETTGAVGVDPDKHQ